MGRAKSYMQEALDEALALWVRTQIQADEEHAAWQATRGRKISKRDAQCKRGQTRRMAAAARPHLAAFARQNTHLSAEQLQELAIHLSPGGAHTGATLIRIIHRNVLSADPLLVAAVIRFNWHGGKIGFQFLPDPATTDPDQYDEEAWDILTALDEGTGGDPRRILTGADLDFFASLPDRFTVYRGAQGLTPERVAAGVCWTTRREVAEWFASRGGRDAAVVVTAKCRKTDIRLAKADECEVVTIPARARQIRCRPHRKKGRPEMTWTA